MRKRNVSTDPLHNPVTAGEGVTAFFIAGDEGTRGGSPVFVTRQREKIDKGLTTRVIWPQAHELERPRARDGDQHRSSASDRQPGAAESHGERRPVVRGRMESERA